MLKVHFIKKFFSIKKCFLDKSLLGSLEFQPHLLEAWRAAPQPGQGSLGETWQWQARTMQPRGGPTGSSGACVFKAAAETVVAVAAAAVGACAPHGCFRSTVGSSVAQLVLRLRLESGLGSTTQETLAWDWASGSISGGSSCADFLMPTRGLGTGLEDFVSIISAAEAPIGLDFWACRAS